MQLHRVHKQWTRAIYFDSNNVLREQCLWRNDGVVDHSDEPTATAAERFTAAFDQSRPSRCMLICIASLLWNKLCRCDIEPCCFNKRNAKWANRVANRWNRRTVASCASGKHRVELNVERGKHDINAGAELSRLARALAICSKWTVFPCLKSRTVSYFPSVEMSSKLVRVRHVPHEIIMNVPR